MDTDGTEFQKSTQHIQKVTEQKYLGKVLESSKGEKRGLCIEILKIEIIEALIINNTGSTQLKLRIELIIFSPKKG